MAIKQIQVGSTKHDLCAKYDDADNIITNTYLPKLTYEWNKSYNAGGTAGYLLIGSFPMYDSNLTIDIDATTFTTYHGTVVIATQNVSTTSMGSSHTITVYGDPTGTISNAIRVVWNSGSRNYNVYFAPSTWSKNLIHIRAIGNYLEDTDVSKICTQFTTGTAPATTSGLTVVNALTSTFGLTKDKVITALGYTPPTSDTNTTYSAGTGISLSGTTFSNSGVRSISTGSSNGTISVNTNGSSANVAVKGLGSAAYTASTAYATAAQGTLATNAMPKSGGTFTGAVNMGSNTFTTRKVNFNGSNSWISDHDGSGHVLFAFNQNSSQYKGQVILTTTGIFRPFNKSGEGAVGTETAFSLGMVSAPWEEVVSKIFRVPAGGVLTTAYTGSGNAVWVASSSSNPTSYSLRSSKALSSSRTIKHDIKPLQDKELQAENLYDINVYQAKYNADIIAEDDCRYLKDMPMFIIEEMNEIYPIAITKPMDDVKSWSWEPAYLIPPMLKLVQDQKKQIDELEKRLQKLEEAK